MRIRNLAAALTVALATLASPALAQRTGDQARLVFTVSAAYMAGTTLWHVPNQPVRDGVYDISRSIDGRLGAGMSATYFKGEHLGLTADAFIFELAYGDGCSLVQRADTVTNLGCTAINEASDRSALAAVLSVGGIFRIASREMVSPYARVNVGMLISNQSSLLTQGFVHKPGTPGGTPPTLIQVYNDDRKSRVGAALGLGVGFTTPLSTGFQFRFEVRDNIVGIQAVDGATAVGDLNPPHSIAYKHLVGIMAGIDLVLEQSRGRRY